MLARAAGLLLALILLASCSSGGTKPATQATAASTSTTAATTAPLAATTTTATTTTVPSSTTTKPATTVAAVTTTTTKTGLVPAADMLNPNVTQATISTTICVSGFTKTIRPPVSFTDALKVHQILTYAYADRNVADYEEDHVIALEIGGAPSALANLFPEPHQVSGADDNLENQLHAAVCQGRLTLAQAQQQLFAAKVGHGYSRAASTT